MNPIMKHNNSRRYAFFFKGTNGKAVLLIHGITGTPAEMRYIGKALYSAGFSVFCNTLPRHCSTLTELKKVTWQEIGDACIRDFQELKKAHPQVFVAGLSMGALMSVHLAYQYPDAVSGIIALAPTLFYDGWALQKGKTIMQLLWHIPWIRNSVNIREGWPYGLKDEYLRKNIERFYKKAKAGDFDQKVFLFGSPFFPVANLYQHHRFSQLVKKEMPRVLAPILILHARQDDMTSLKNAHYLYDNIGSRDKSLIVLENSYHMITIDQEKDRVAREIVNFLNRFA